MNDPHLGRRSGSRWGFLAQRDRYLGPSLSGRFPARYCLSARAMSLSCSSKATTSPASSWSRARRPPACGLAVRGELARERGGNVTTGAAETLQWARRGPRPSRPAAKTERLELGSCPATTSSRPPGGLHRVTIGPGLSRTPPAPREAAGLAPSLWAGKPSQDARVSEKAYQNPRGSPCSAPEFVQAEGRGVRTPRNASESRNPDRVGVRRFTRLAVPSADAPLGRISPEEDPNSAGWRCTNSGAPNRLRRSRR
jgi:hypothetical protein